MSELPSSDELIRRAMIRATRAMFATDLQLRRLKTSEPEDTEFLGRRVADFEFLVVAATRLRRAAVLARKVPVIQQRITDALDRFDQSCPTLKRFRDVAEHIDEYSIGRGFDANIDRQYLENYMLTEEGQTWTWLGDSINTADLLRACRALYNELRCARDDVT